MSDQIAAFFTGVFLTAIVMLMLAAFTVQPNSECIKHGAAHYDQQSGAFTWNK